MNTETLDFEKGGGLLPAIVQDAGTGQVLMLGYMNREALDQTLQQKKVTFYSRSRNRLWTKGERSGHILRLVDIQQDCDEDALLVLAEPEGPTCHTGDTSCFHRKEFIPERKGFLPDLEELIRSRRREKPEGSYTTSLFDQGVDMIAQKVGEEAVETVIAAKNSDTDAFVGESADLLYHLMILLAEKNLSLADIEKRLEERNRQDVKQE